MSTSAPTTSTPVSTTASDSLTDLIPLELFDSAKVIVVGFSVIGAVIAIIIATVIACRYYRYRVSDKGRRQSIMKELKAEYKKKRREAKQAAKRAKKEARSKEESEKRRVDKEIKDWNDKMKKRKKKFGNDDGDEFFINPSPSTVEGKLDAQLLDRDDYAQGGTWLPTYSKENASREADPVPLQQEEKSTIVDIATSPESHHQKQKGKLSEIQTNLGDDELLVIPYPKALKFEGDTSSSDSETDVKRRRRRFDTQHPFPSPRNNHTRYVPLLPNPIQRESSFEMWSAHRERGAALEEERWLSHQREEFQRLSKIPVHSPLRPLSHFKDTDTSKLANWKPSSPEAQCRFVSETPFRL